MFDKRIMVVLIFIVSLLCVSSVSAFEEEGNSTDISDNASITVDKALNVNESSLNGTAQSGFARISTDEIKPLSVTPSKLSTTWGSGKSFSVKVADGKTGKPEANVKLILKVFSGNELKKIIIKSDSDGIAKYSSSSLSVGSHKVLVTVKDPQMFSSKEKSSMIIISKVKLSVSAPKITSYYKESKKYQITVKNKETEKPMKDVNVFIKVFTGKKYKSYSLKTDKKGIASFNTKSLTKGKHNVVVDIKATSKIKSASLKTYIKTVQRSNVIKLKVNNHVLNVKLEDNSAAKSLMSKLKKSDITIYAEDYGNFEKVGELGFSLPRSDRYMTTSAGDIVLYEGDEISLFYNSNSWSYTKLGKVQNIKDLKKILGNGDVKLVFTLK